MRCKKKLASFICGAWTSEFPPFSAVPKVQSCDFLVRGGSIRHVRVLRRCLRRLGPTNTKRGGKNPGKKTAVFSDEGCWKFQEKCFFLVEGCWKSWENPGGSKFHLVKSAVSKLRGDSSFWPHWFNQSGTLTLAYDHDWVEISQITSKC